MTRCCWISGNLYDRKITLDKIKKQFAVEDIEVVGALPYSLFEFTVLNNSCFSDKRLIIVTAMPEPSGTKATMLNHLKKLIDSIPESVLLVFFGIPAEDEKALSGHIAKVGKLFDFPVKLEANAAANWVVAQFRDDNKTIQIEDAQLMVDTCGFDENVNAVSTDVLRLAVRKVSDYMGRRRTVTKDDVIVNIFPSENFVIWSIYDDIDSRSFDQCQNMFFRLIENCNGSVEEAINFMFNVIMPRFRMLFFLKEAIAKGMTKGEATAAAMKMLKLRSKGEHEQMTMYVDVDADGAPKPSWTTRAIDGALNSRFGKEPAIDRYTRKDLVRIINTLQDCFTEMRVRQTDADLLVLADVFFLSLGSKLDDKVLEKLRNSNG